MSLKMFRSALACVLVILLWSAQAFAEAVMVDAGNPPFMFEAQGKAVGIYPAILAEVFKKMGADADIKAVPWKRAITAIDEGSAGVGGIYKNEERLKKYDYSDKLFDEVIQLYVRKGEEFTYSGVDSLAGKKVGVMRGWSYGDAFDAAVKSGKLTVDEVEADTPNFQKLAGKRVDVVLAIRESGDSILAEPEFAGKIVALAAPLSSSPSFLAFNKSANKTDLLAKFNEEIAKMRSDGSMAAVIKANLGGK